VLVLLSGDVLLVSELVLLLLVSVLVLLSEDVLLVSEVVLLLDAWLVVLEVGVGVTKQEQAELTRLGSIAQFSR